jgi:hypothetical protein
MFRLNSTASLVFAGALIIGSAQAMTRLAVEMTCPYDGIKFTFNAQNSGTAFDRLLDGMALGAIESPWPLAICPTNGFVFLKENYEADELERLRPLILSSEYQKVKDETPYYRAAWIMERSGSSHSDASRFLVQATWEAGFAELAERGRNSAASLSAQDANKLFGRLMAEGTTGERYRRYATELLARLQVDVADASRSLDARVADRLLIGELLRRLGRFTEAGSHFVSLVNDLNPASKEAMLAEFQRKLIAGSDAGLHSVSEALGGSQRR